MANYAVGDIQGCLSHLQRLLEKASFSTSDRLWFAGDLVNRGPESLETLRFVKQLGQQASVVLGNHDLHLLACHFGIRKPTRKDTFNEILAAEDRHELMAWLIQQPLFHRDKQLGFSMVHAGIPPNWDIDSAHEKAKEVEAALRSDSPLDFFENMYGNQPDIWHEKLEGAVRRRVITNYFTRMRFCDAHGRLEFKSKCSPDEAPAGYLPWYAHPEHKCATDNVIFGHWAAMLGKTQRENFIGLDTGCVWGGELTMMRLEDRSRICVDCAL